MTFFDYVIVLLTLTSVAAWLWLYLCYGREHRVSAVAGSLKDPPADWTPIQLSRLWTWDRGSVRDPIASILDLVRHDVLYLIPDPVTVLGVGGMSEVTPEFEYSIGRAACHRQNLSSAERYLIEEVIFRGSNADVVSLTDLVVEGARHHPEVFDRLDRWHSLAWDEPPAIPLEDPVSERMSGHGFTIGLMLMLLSFVLAVTGSAFVLLGIGAGGGLLAGSRHIRRRSPEAVQALEEWRAYSRYLGDDLSLADKPAHAVEVWGRHLVYAVTLDVATRAIRQFRLLSPDYEGIQRSRWMYD
jgi:hypothetical protein